MLKNVTFALVLAAIALSSSSRLFADDCDIRKLEQQNRAVWFDDFRAEFAAHPKYYHPWIPLNFTKFNKWNVTKGSVDYIPVVNGHGYWFEATPFDLDTPFVDLDGTTFQSGKIETKSMISLKSGRYSIAYEIAGNQGRDVRPDGVQVKVGSVVNQFHMLEPMDTFQTHYKSFLVGPRGMNVKISVENIDGHMHDDQGPLLRNIGIFRGNLDHCEE